MYALFDRMVEVARTDASVIIEGETGTGKELVAEAIHELGARSGRPYVVIDCAAVPPELIESEMFGHAKGAFTGAVSDRQGAFEAADGGTIFIDEIGELPVELQPRLLRVLEKQEIKRVGTNATRPINVRVVAATNRDLRREIDAGRFREDLYFRLNVVRLEIPPLRERPDDVIFLTERFLSELSGPNGPIRLREETKPKLTSYPWPGNVRELRNLVDRGAALSDQYFRLPDDFGRPLGLTFSDDGRALGSGVELTGSALREPERAPQGGWEMPGEVTRPLWEGKTYKDAKEAVIADFERGYITLLLQNHGGNVSGAARSAGIHRNILHRMISRYGIKR